jgi:hypothetical protein
MGTRAALQVNDQQFENGRSVWPGGNGIASPPLGGFLMNRQVKRNKLPRHKVKRFPRNQLNPESPGGSRFIFNSYYSAGLPGKRHGGEGWWLNEIVDGLWYTVDGSSMRIRT